MNRKPVRVVCVIPTYRARATIADVVTAALRYCDTVIVVDDKCPDGSGEVAAASFSGNAAVRVLYRDRNGGVGAAMKSGIEGALALGADVIVKLDADGQMNPAFVPLMVDLLAADSSLACVKGNRFFDGRTLERMPRARLIGNAALSLMAKFASGYWNSIDPTNGYLALNTSVLRMLPWQMFSDSYFFELSLLCELGLRQLPLLELEMPAIYTDAPSSLSIWKVLVEFPPRLAKATGRRLLVQYLIRDVNLGTLYALIGAPLLAFGLGFGLYEWIDGLIVNTPRATGTIMLAALPFLMGFQLLLNALMYDVQFSRRTEHRLLASLRPGDPALQEGAATLAQRRERA